MLRKAAPASVIAVAAAVVAVLAAVVPTPVSAGAGSHRHAPATWVLGPVYATGCPVYARCGSGDDMAGEVTSDLDQLASHDIPVAGYLFDGSGWSSGACTWALGDQLIERLSTANVRATLHVWGGCDTVDQLYGVYGRLGDVLGAFYLDERSTDAFAGAAFDAMRSLTTDGEVVMKAYQGDGRETDAGLAACGHTAYVNDLDADFGGMRNGIARVFGKRTLLAAPYNEFTGYDGRRDALTEEAYFRRLHWGAMQMVMEHDCVWDCDPWGSRYASYSPALLSAYRYYTWLHTELVPYLHSYDYQMYETGEPVFRESDPTKYTTKLGDELFVAYVTQPGLRALDVTLPAGQWINYWNELEMYDGGSTIAYPVPLGREPIFIRNGAVIPMRVSRDYTGHGTSASAGSLTVLVYPSGDSSFAYRDEGYWLTFSSGLYGGVLTLSASRAPSQPVIYRVGRWTKEPFTVRVDGNTVIVNERDAGPRAVHMTSEDAVNAAPVSAWYYDGSAGRLIVKVVAQTVPRVDPTRAYDARPRLMDATPFRLLPRWEW